MPLTVKDEVYWLLGQGIKPTGSVIGETKVKEDMSATHTELNLLIINVKSKTVRRRLLYSQFIVTDLNWLQTTSSFLVIIVFLLELSLNVFRKHV